MLNNIRGPLKNNNSNQIYKLKNCQQDSPWLLAQICKVDQATNTITSLPGHEAPVRQTDTIPLYVKENVLLCSSLDPQSFVFRTHVTCNLIFPKHSQILSSLHGNPTPHYMSNWSGLLPDINWKLTINQRNKAYIPSREKDVLLRIHCNTLPTAQRLHLPQVSPYCSSCSPDEYRGLASIPPNCQPSSMSTPKEETLLHFLSECPPSRNLLSTLGKVISSHYNQQLVHPLQTLFPIPHTPEHGFPFLLLTATAFRQLWLERCNKRFDRISKKPRTIMIFILHLFKVYCSSYLISLKNMNTKKAKNLYNQYKDSAQRHRMLLFSPSGDITVHPELINTWLKNVPFQPP